MNFRRLPNLLARLFSITCLISFAGCQNADRTQKADAEGIQGTRPILASFIATKLSETTMKVDIAGSNFRAGASVEIKSVSCTDVVIIDANYLTCTLQGLFEFALSDILITNPGGESSFTNPAGGGSALPTLAYHTVFVSSSTSLSGNLGGLAGADSICTSLALNEYSLVHNLPGKWKAILSGSGVDARDRFVFKSGVPVRNPNGQVVMQDNSKLFDRDLDSVINVNEKGITVAAGSRVWTGSLSRGRSATHHCASFATADSGSSGKLGIVGGTNSSWLSDNSTTCDTPAIRIYCMNSNEPL